MTFGVFRPCYSRGMRWRTPPKNFWVHILHDEKAAPLFTGGLGSSRVPACLILGLGVSCPCCATRRSVSEPEPNAMSIYDLSSRELLRLIAEMLARLLIDKDIPQPDPDEFKDD